MGKVVVIGGANMDLKARSSDAVVPGTSNPGRSVLSAGGVGRNIAENLARLGTPVRLVSVVGDDNLGTELLAYTESAGVDVQSVRRRPVATGSYAAVLDADGELVVAIADMAAADEISPLVVRTAEEAISTADLVVIDGNLRADTVTVALEVAAAGGARVIFEPVSVPKAAKLASLVGSMWMVTPNVDELGALAGIPVTELTDQDRIVAAARVLVAQGVEIVWVRRGLAGSLLVAADSVARLEAVEVEVADVTGAGDAMLAAFCHRLLSAGPTWTEADLVDAARWGHAAASLTVASRQTVRSDLSDHMIKELR